MLVESGACCFLVLNDLTYFYLRCRFACDSLALRNFRLLRIVSILLLPAEAALLRSPPLALLYDLSLLLLSAAALLIFF